MSEIHGAVGSYVVNALDDSELDEFQAHLAVCDTCQREVVEFSETAAQLSLLVETPPPAALRGSILSAIREVRPLPPEVRPSLAAAELQSVPTRTDAQPDPEMSSDNVAADTGVIDQDVLELERAARRVDELALRRTRRTARMLTFAVAAAMVVALALGGWAVNLVQQRQAQVASARLETQLLSAPDAKVYATSLNDGTRVSYVVSRSLDKGMFIGNDLPAPGAGKKYQLWTIDSSGAHPDSVFDGGSGRKTWFTGSVGKATAVAVTVEPSTGSAKPTLPAQAQTKL